MNASTQTMVTGAAHEVRMLRSRASSLTEQAKALPGPLATTYRRRARELALEAYLLEQATVAG
jgi:hypothetical protein